MGLEYDVFEREAIRALDPDLPADSSGSGESSSPEATGRCHSLASILPWPPRARGATARKTRGLCEAFRAGGLALVSCSRQLEGPHRVRACQRRPNRASASGSIFDSGARMLKSEVCSQR